MNRITLLITLCLITSCSFGQTEKPDLVEAVAKKHHLLPNLMVDNFVTVNVSPDIWKKMTNPASPMGITTFNNLGIGITKFLDYTQGTTLNKLCGFSVDDKARKSNLPLCEDQLKESKGKISVTVNATNVRLTDDSYKLLMLAVGTVGLFLEKREGAPGVREGWKPRAKTISFVVDTGKSDADLGARWNPDFSVCTITASPYIEVPGWRDKLLQVLSKGVTNCQ